MDSMKQQDKTLPLPSALAQLMNLGENRPYLTESAPADTETFEGLLFQWAEESMTAECLAQFKAEFSQAELIKACQSGEKSKQFAFGTPERQQRRLVIRFMADDQNKEILGILSLYAVHESGAAPAESGIPLEVLAMPYAAFAGARLDQDTLTELRIVKDDLSFFSGAAEGSCEAFFAGLCENHVLNAWQEDYQRCFSCEEIKKTAEGNRLISHTFISGMGQLHQDVFVLRTDDRVMLYIGVVLQEKPALLDVKSADVAAHEAALADLQMAMMFERKEMKAHTRRTVAMLTVLALLAGCVLGAVLDRQGGFYSSLLNQYYPQPTATPAAEATVTPEPAATAQPVVPIYVSRLESATFSAEVSSTGTARTNTMVTEYDTYSFTAKVTNVMEPKDFEGKYGKIVMDGTEACVVFNLQFSAIAKENKQVIPQEAFLISLVGSDGETVEEYQLMDKAVNGKYNVSLSDGTEKRFYKRYQYSDKIDYLVISCYQDGQRQDYYFALKYDDPNVTHSTLKFDQSKLMVRYLKTKLKALGYYSGQINEYFDSATVKAVKAAQADFGMEQTGIADNAFQQTLYAK